MIAIALLVLGFITLLTAGIVIGVTRPEILTVFSTPVRADTRQVYLTGLVTGLALMIALLLLRRGVRRSRLRARQLRRQRSRGRHAVERPEPEEA